MKIRYLNGRRLSNAIVAATQRIRERQEYLNKINVFPVPDGDTGTNMVLTMQHVADSAATNEAESIEKASQDIADSALAGARGNSGAILAQFFQGLAENLTGKVRVTTKEFAEAARQSVANAYEAMSDPREGTILTVISDWAEKIDEQSHKLADFTELLHVGLHEAKESLRRTPEKLKVLAKAGVVDAGAQGFVHLLEGVINFIESGKIEHILEREIDRIENMVHNFDFHAEITFRYCTEGLIEGEEIDRKALRLELKELGDSLIVAGSNRKVRVHIHTNEPDKVYDILQEHGTLVKQKIEDMQEQHEKDFSGTETGKIALVVDSTCDLPAEFFQQFPIRFVPVWVNFGTKSFIDKVTLSTEEFYQKLVTDPDHPKTSQPAAADFAKTFSELLGRYEKVICLTVSSQFSGTYQSALAAARLVNNPRLEIVDSESTSIGFAMVVAEALKQIEADVEYEKVLENIRKNIPKRKVFVYIDTMTYLIRGGRVSKAKGFVANLLNLRPVLQLAGGQIIPVDKVRGERDGMKSVMKFIEKTMSGYEGAVIALTHTNAPDRARVLQELIRERFNLEPQFVVNASPALGTHAGPGAVGVAVLPF
jgi:DegV family protein with EDD domain